MPRPETTPANEVDAAQENRGRGVRGGGEWPDPDTAPSGPAPGTTAYADEVAAGRDAVPTAGDPLEGVSPEDAATRTLPDDERD